eukprot:scaffold9400_cov58-Cylindrotheca_fusiformis.AAC.1
MKSQSSDMCSNKSCGIRPSGGCGSIEVQEQEAASMSKERNCWMLVIANLLTIGASKIVSLDVELSKEKEARTQACRSTITMPWIVS